VYVKEFHSPDKVEQVIESRDLKGGPAITLLKSGPRNAKGGIRGFYWLPDGRILYSQRDPDVDEASCNYWEIPVDARTGEPKGKPRQLTHWAGFCVDMTSATADGKRVAFRRWSVQNRSYVAELESNGTRLSNPRPLTSSEGHEYPSRWTADSKSVIFQSNRNGPYGIFRQFLDENVREPLLLAESDTFIGDTIISPDGAWAVYLADQKDGGDSAQVMRVPIAGGLSQPVLTLDHYGPPRCARSPAVLCVMAEQTPDRKQVVFTGFDPIKGRGRELTRFDVNPKADYAWDLSPDGTRIAIAKAGETHIDLIDTSGKPIMGIAVKGWDLGLGVDGFDWALDQKGLFITSRTQQGGEVLLHVDLQGNTHKLWEAPRASGLLWGIPSPDGRHLAFPNNILNSNMWMVENF
jgi:Tol biopolymer transport system component